MLLTSELVTNAIVHAGTEVEVVCQAYGGQVKVEVHDRHQARRIPVPGDQVSGRGLLFPETLATSWGVTYGQGDKHVWFTLPGPAGEGQSPSRPRRPEEIVPSPRPVRSTVDQLAHRTAQTAQDALDADCVYVLLAEDDAELVLKATSGVRPEAAAPGDGPGRGSGRRPWRVRGPGRQPVQPAGPAGRGDPLAGHRAVRDRRPGDRAADRRLARRRPLRRGRRRAAPADRRPPGGPHRARTPHGARTRPPRMARVHRRGEQHARRHRSTSR